MILASVTFELPGKRMEREMGWRNTITTDFNADEYGLDAIT
jgi:hypothetical protein